MRTRKSFELKAAVLGMLILGAASAVVSCEREVEYEPASERVGVSFGVVVEDAEPVETKSLLPVPDIETKLTSVSVAVYQSGSIVDRKYFTGTLSNMELTVERGRAFNVYVLANMGDMRSVFPSDESGVSMMTYSIPSYTGSDASLSERGLPMCGRAEYASGATDLGTVTLKRLMAKVTANISCSWAGAQIASVKVYNLNGTLCPYGTGGSRAVSSSDIMSVQEYSAGTSSASGTFVFYVPENCQGTIPGVTDSSSKSPDYNATVNARQAILTYIETHVNGSGKYGGYIDYRSYLGGSATSNFDIIRNKGYVWNLTFSEDGIQVSDWKHGNFLTWNEYRYALSKSSMTLNVGSSDTFQVWRYTDTYSGGSKTSTGTVPEVVAVSAYSFSSASSSIASASASGSNAVSVSGVAQGTTSINVSVSGTALSLPVTVWNVYSVSVSPTEATLVVGNSQSFTATVRRNGTVMSAAEIAAEGTLTWTSSNTAYATVSNSGQITGVAPGNVTITLTYTPNGQSAVTAISSVTIVSSSGGNMDTGWDEGDEIEL